MKASDIPDKDILGFILGRRGEPCTWFEFGPNSLTEAVSKTTPSKVLLAKLRALYRRGFIEGCVCGCRGDFKITLAGMAFLNE